MSALEIKLDGISANFSVNEKIWFNFESLFDFNNVEINIDLRIMLILIDFN